MISLDKLSTAICLSWGPDTSFVPAEWTTQNPARGNCVVTALVVQHFLGGELRKYDTVFQDVNETHYTNLLPDGTEVDLTGRQYPDDQVLVPSEVNLHGYRAVRDKMMHEPNTVRQYEILLGRVTANLGT